MVMGQLTDLENASVKMAGLSRWNERGVIVYG